MDTLKKVMNEVQVNTECREVVNSQRTDCIWGGKENTMSDKTRGMKMTANWDTTSPYFRRAVREGDESALEVISERVFQELYSLREDFNIEGLGDEDDVADLIRERICEHIEGLEDEDNDSIAEEETENIHQLLHDGQGELLSAEQLNAMSMWKGEIPPDILKAEEYDGTTWSGLADLIRQRQAHKRYVADVNKVRPLVARGVQTEVFHDLNKAGLLDAAFEKLGDRWKSLNETERKSLFLAAINTILDTNDVRTSCQYMFAGLVSGGGNVLACMDALREISDREMAIPEVVGE